MRLQLDVWNHCRAIVAPESNQIYWVRHGSGATFETGLIHVVNHPSTNIQFWVNNSRHMYPSGTYLSLLQDWIISNVIWHGPDIPLRDDWLCSLLWFFLYPYFSSWFSLYLRTVHFECIYSTKREINSPAWDEFHSSRDVVFICRFKFHSLWTIFRQVRKCLGQIELKSNLAEILVLVESC